MLSLDPLINVFLTVSVSVEALKDELLRLEVCKSKMKVESKSFLFSILITFRCSLCKAQDVPVNNDINSECTIPNQNKTKGIYVERRNCAEYEELFNVSELTVERLSFVINLNCGFDHDVWKSLICCPLPGSSYKYVEKYGLGNANLLRSYF